MFELPEYVTLAQQCSATLAGKVIAGGSLGNSPHKFVWYNRTPDEFVRLITGKTIGRAHARAKWLFIPLDPGYVLLLGDCGGRLLYHAPGAPLPAKCHLSLGFSDGSALTAMTAMWGAMELHEAGRVGERQYLRDMRPTPVDPAFTLEYLAGLINALREGQKRSVKGLLTTDQLIPGLGNAIAQDIMFRAGLHPKHPIGDLSQARVDALYHAIGDTLEAVIAGGGRDDEFDLYNHAGRYRRVMDGRAAGHPCPTCATTVEKMQYLGGACYYCPGCQV